MARYSAGISVSGINTANSAYIGCRPTATTDRLFIVKISIGIAVAPTTAPSFYLSRSTANGTESGALAGQAFDPANPAPVGQIAGYSVQPTFSTTNKIDVGGMAVTAGGQWIWTFFDQPLIVTNSTTAGIVIVNANASGATTGTFLGAFVWDE